MQTFYTTTLRELYGDELAPVVHQRLRELIHRYRGQIPQPENSSLTERDS
ncbi:MAG: hypothetical protein HUU11_01860, partial [Anaerolineales bacterium]|nr:hypothetical protein [Anaerolineales bacterium]